MKPIVVGISLFTTSLALAISIFLWGEKIGLVGVASQVVVWACLSIVTSLIFFSPIITRALWSKWSGNHSGVNHLKPEIMQDVQSESARLIGVAQRWEHLKQFHHLTSQYKDHRKPWILVCGDDEILETVFPGIKESLWMESHSAFWLDAQAVEPAGGWGALRGAGKRPAEGVVCLSEEKNNSERFEGQLRTVLEKMNWLLPVNRVFIGDSLQLNGVDGVAGVASHIMIGVESKENIQEKLDVFANQLAALGTQSIEANVNNIFAAALSQRLKQADEGMAESIYADKRALGKLDSLNRVSYVQSAQDLLPDLIYQSFDAANVFGKGKKLKWSKGEKVFGALSAAALLLTGVFTYAAYNSYQDISRFQAGLAQLQAAPATPTDYSSLVDFQNEILQLENQQSGFNGGLIRTLGYDHSERLLNVAYAQYGASAKQAVVIPAANKLMDQLYELNGSSVEVLGEASEAGQEYYNALKAYLMLTERVDKVDSAFLAEKMTSALNQQGLKTPQSHNIAAFFSKNLPKHPNWALDENTGLVDSSRKVLAAWLGSSQAEERIYTQIIENAKEKYSEISLTKLLGRDARGIWDVAKTLPGVYTARGWEEYVKPAFEKAAQNDSGDDWVLADNLKNQPVNEAIINSLKERYFNEYAAAWFNMLNSITWVPKVKTLDAVNQLHVYADHSVHLLLPYLT